MNRIISVSTVAYDGYPLEIVFKHLVDIGIKYVELAFIKGYIEDFNEDLFSLKNAYRIKKLLRDFDLQCYVVSAHISLGTADALKKMLRRIEFASQIGAKIIITNAALNEEGSFFYKNIDEIIRYAERYNILIGLENPGDGVENIMNNGFEAFNLLNRIGSSYIRVNYDFANTITHSGGLIIPEDDVLKVLPICIHFHLKNVKKLNNIWVFPGIDEGLLDYKKILSSIIPKDIPISLELPLRLRREKDGIPFRLPEPVKLDIIDGVIKKSIDFVLRYS